MVPIARRDPERVAAVVDSRQIVPEGFHPAVHGATSAWTRVVATIGNSNEARLQCSGFILENQALLVVPQGGDHHLARQLEEALVEVAEQQLQQATDFVIENNIVTVPDDPVEIIIMPEFQRGVSVAYLDPPGPLDKGQSAFYAVAPLPADWTEGNVTGLRARGGYTVDITWANGKVNDYRIVALKPSQVEVCVDGQVKTVMAEAL